jgi:hypothetical protein
MIPEAEVTLVHSAGKPDLPQGRAASRSSV